MGNINLYCYSNDFLVYKKEGVALINKFKYFEGF